MRTIVLFHIATRYCSRRASDTILPPNGAHEEGNVMSKGLNQKKDAKKKPAKSLKEKRAEKQAKKAGK